MQTRGFQGHEICDGNNVYVGLRLREATMEYMKLLLSKDGSLMRGGVG